MKSIKLSGRETAVLRAIDTQGSTGAEIHQRTQISVLDLADILGALCEVGYLEAYPNNSSLPATDPVASSQVLGTRFEINPSYAGDLKKALFRL